MVLPLDSSGNVKVSTQASGGTSNVNLATKIAGEDQTNDRLKTFPLPVQADSILTIIQNAVSTAVNGSTDAVAGYKKLAFMLTITATITVTFQGSVDGGVTFFSLACQNSTSTTDGTLVTTATASGLFVVPEKWAGVLTHLRAPTSGPSGSPSATVNSIKCP